MIVELLFQGGEALGVQRQALADSLQQGGVAEAPQAVIERVAHQVGQHQQHRGGVGVERARGHQGAGDHGHRRTFDDGDRQDDRIAVLAQQGDGVGQEEVWIENLVPPFGA